MAIKEHGGISGDDLYPPQIPEDTLPTGEPIRVNQVDYQVLGALKPHYSDWRFLKKSDAEKLGEHKRLRFFAKDGKHWIEVRDGQNARRYDDWIAFVKPLHTQKSSGGAGSSKSTNASDAVNRLAKPFLNLDPTVSITTPTSGRALKLTDQKAFKNHLVDHKFVSGDTVTSVAKKYSGSDDPGAIYDFNNFTYTKSRPPQTGDSARVLAGRELLVDGSVQNSAFVTLSWQGPTSGTKTIENTKGGDNEYVSWETAIPVQAGAYTLTVKASGAISNIVTLDLIDPGAHWVRFKLFDENDKLVKEKELDYLVRFDEGTEIRSKLKEGLDYLTGVPLFPFTLEIIPGNELNLKLDELRKNLRTELDISIAQVKADTAIHEKEWKKIGNLETGFIYLGAGLSGAGEWVVDTATGVTELATGIVNANIVTYAWTGKYIQHRINAFSSYASGDVDGLKQSTQNIEVMHKELGKDISEIGEHAETLALLAWDDETRNMLVDFPGDYFSELSGVEQTRAVTRYGIDFLLIFVGGIGAGMLAIKNAAKISKLLKEMLEIIKKLRFQQTVKKPKVDETYPLTPPKKKVMQTEKEVIELEGGQKGGWNKELNNPEPNKIYKVKGYTYETDELGRVTLVKGAAKLKTANRNTYQQSKVGKSGKDGDEGGHLVASIFDGPGEKINLLPMDANLNKGAWKKMENKWADALKEGKQVDMEVKPKYIGDSTRPSEFIVRQSIDGVKSSHSFKNQPGG